MVVTDLENLFPNGSLAEFNAVVLKLPEIENEPFAPPAVHELLPVIRPEAVVGVMVPLKFILSVHVIPDWDVVQVTGTIKLLPSALAGAVPLIIPSDSVLKLTVTMLPVIVILICPEASTVNPLPLPL